MTQIKKIVLLEEKIRQFPKNKQQAIKSKSGYLRIIAGAGAGKTTTLAMKIVYLLCNGFEPKDIVAFTFTEKAAQNMKNKIFEEVKEIKPEAYNKLGEMYIGTIHSFCFQMLQDHFGYGNYDVLDENKEMAFILRNGWAFGLGKSGNYTANCAKFLNSIAVIYDEILPAEKLRKKAEDFYRQFEKYEKMLNDHKLLTFSMMIPLLIKNLESNIRLLKYIKHLFVDEYQDINKAQQKLISIIGSWSNVYAVGDPRQSIYQWRGSDKEYFDSFSEIFKKAECIDIPENFRSCKQIVEKANLFASSLKDKYPSMKPSGENGKKEGEVIKIAFDNPEDEATKITKQIKELVDKRVCNYSSIAILLRSVKTSGKPIIDELKKIGIPYVVGGKLGLFQRDESKIVGMLFAWTYENGFWSSDPYTREHIEGNDLLENAKSLWSNIFIDKKFPEEKIKKWKKEVNRSSYSDLTDAFQELIVILGFAGLDIDEKKNAAMLANLGRFNELLTDFQTSILLGGGVFRWDKNLKDLCWFMNSYGLEAYGEKPAEDIRGLDAVQIMTIHQAKGLEWPMVFVPALTSKRFPSAMTGRNQQWYIPRELFPAARYEGDEDDERRLFYVTITRAREVLFLSYFKQINRPMVESPFLTELKLKETAFGKGIKLSGVGSLKKEDELQTFSPGELIDYCRCSYCYKLRHLWGYQAKFGRMLGYGKSLHHVLRRVSEIVKENKIDPEKTVDEVFEAEFHLPFADKKLRALVGKKAKETLKKYVAKRKQDILNISEVETRIEFPVEKATIAGRVDVIMGQQDSLEVRDYKTSDLVTTPEESAFQVQLYSLGLSLMEKKIHKGSIAYIKEMDGKTDLIPVDVCKKNLEEAKKFAEEVIKNIKNGICKPKQGEFCESRDYSRLCKFANKKKIKMVVKPD